MRMGENAHLISILLYFIQVPQRLRQLRHCPISLSSEFVAQCPDRFALFHHLSWNYHPSFRFSY